jgi:hypothetical protein
VILVCWNASPRISVSSVAETGKIVLVSSLYLAEYEAEILFEMFTNFCTVSNSVTAFIVNESFMVTADKHGKSPPDNSKYQAYCTDARSNKVFPYSIFLMVDGKPFVGCCFEPPRVRRRPFGLSHAAMAGRSSMA